MDGCSFANSRTAKLLVGTLPSHPEAAGQTFIPTCGGKKGADGFKKRNQLARAKAATFDGSTHGHDTCGRHVLRTRDGKNYRIYIGALSDQKTESRRSLSSISFTVHGPRPLDPNSRPAKVPPVSPDFKPATEPRSRAEAKCFPIIKGHRVAS